ncbi:hypothetical protein C8024_12575 [Sphingopyxis sp. BSNA05]|nr:hypothetical protein [Sphingopyxis sp. BSNA05]
MSKQGHVVKKFTGYHAAAIIVAFFAVVVGVNLFMARFALSTFSGTVVDNSYVASQKYNDWLEQARNQEEHGWTVSPALREADKASITITTANGMPCRERRWRLSRNILLVGPIRSRSASPRPPLANIAASSRCPRAAGS